MRAVCEEGEQAARSAAKGRGVPAREKPTGGDRSECFSKRVDNNPVVSPTAEYKIVNLYSVNSKDGGIDVPFERWITVQNTRGEKVRVKALFDGGAMVAAMCTKYFNKVKHKLGKYMPSTLRLRMADGNVTPSIAKWTGTICLNGVTKEGSFEVFNSGGGWNFLFGKPLLRQFRIIHDYDTDTIVVQGHGAPTTLRNHNLKAVTQSQTHGTSEAPIHVITTEGAPSEESEFAEVPTDGLEKNPIFTRHTDPFSPKRVDEVLKQVTIGEDLLSDERRQVIDLISSYADCFALSVSEVCQAEGAVHRINVPEGATFSRKIQQRPLTPPQRKYLNEKIDEMLAAGVIEACHPSQIKCVSPTTLAQKAHDGQGLTLEELRHRVNDQCVNAGLPPAFQLPPQTSPTPHNDGGSKDPKWRICQNYGEINKVTEVAPMPQGDIRMKQQKLSGHRWVSIIDFASGFYAVEVDKESRPYTAFYVEGRGYFWYRKMPFGLTGAPSTFAYVTAMHLNDLLVKEVIELIVDDGGAAADKFEDMMDKLRILFDRVRERKLSLSASKSRFFMTTAVFAGAVVGPNGVQPDPAKLTAIVDWQTPKTALNLGAFLGITGWFRDLIRNYAKIEKPLRELQREVDIPNGAKKAVYRRIMNAHDLTKRWGPEHTKAFVALKTALTSEPVLRGPRWDGTPFVITTDGSADAFGAVLAQRMKTVLPGGKVVERLHPIGFASKRTSRTEEKYKPFLLEFAALKFALDKFTNIIWGFPIEIETDCQALRDVLLNDKLSATHARWRDGILAHQIIDVRHVPGRINVVADGLSRQCEEQPKRDGDGSEWTVSEDWEATAGLTHDIFHITPTPETELLQERFKDEPLFREVVEALMEMDQGRSIKERKRARHRASQYMMDEGKLWRVAGGNSTRARARTECITQKEAVKAAYQQHVEGGHWGRDSIKLAMMDQFHSPKLDNSILLAIRDCPQCKNFGPTHLHTLLDPITRRHLLELVVGDYLKMPTGKGGFKTLGVFLDVFTQHVWVTKHKSDGSGKTTTDALSLICNQFAPPDTFMTDGGKHFDCEEVRAFCREWGIKPHITAAYSPWVNGLVEGTNKLLIHILKRQCAPGLGEDEYNATTVETMPATWPKHLDDAVRALNWRVLPALKFKPKELLLGMVVNTPKPIIEQATAEVTQRDVGTHMAYVAQQRLDGYGEAVRHAFKRKSAFDKKVTRRKPGEVIFKLGQLVQVYRSDLDNTFKADRKMVPKWSVPRRVTKQLRNAYHLETTEGTQLPGTFSARRLRAFLPREGTELAENQKRIEGIMEAQAQQQREEEAALVDKERSGEDKGDDDHIGGEDAAILRGGRME